MKRGISSLVGALFAGFALNATADTHYVDLNSPSPTPPYTNWLTAATNIQDAVAASQAGDVVLVTNGVYRFGGNNYQGLNRVRLPVAMMLQSVNGPSVTMIEGYQVPGTKYGDAAFRCVSMVSGAVLSGFTLTNGATTYSFYGGGVSCQSLSAIVTNCVIVGNASRYAGGGAYGGTLVDCRLEENVVTGPSGDSGGGAYQSVLINCELFGNISSYRGGGASSSILTNCVVIGNYATQTGGGTLSGGSVNCVIFGNTAPGGAGGVDAGTHQNSIVTGNIVSAAGSSASNYLGGAFSHCCTFPKPSSGLGNITNAPLFMDYSSGDFRLHPDSPCLNAGTNLASLPAFDKNRRTRIVQSTVDMGAYEYQGAETEAFISWLSSFGLPSNASSDHADTDGDGANTWHEWRSDTVPTNAASALRMAGVSNGVMGLNVSWDSVGTRSYWLERGEDLGAAPAFRIIATNIPGVAGTKTFNDTSATNGGPYFYRVGVE